MFGISEKPRWDHPFPRTGCNLDRHVEYIKADGRRRENNRVEMKAPPEPTNAGQRDTHPFFAPETIMRILHQVAGVNS
jgi:hypothetical protein